MRWLLLALLLPTAGYAQSSTWQVKAKIQSGQCPDGLVAFITEQPGKARLNLASDGQPAGQIDMTLAPDGSGSAETSGRFGPTTHKIAAGAGKRPITTSTNDGKCRWTWQ